MLLNQVPALDDPVCFRLNNIIMLPQKKNYIMDELKRKNKFSDPCHNLFCKKSHTLIFTNVSMASNFFIHQMFSLCIFVKAAIIHSGFYQSSGNYMSKRAKTGSV